MISSRNNFELTIGDENRTATLNVKLCKLKPLAFPGTLGDCEYYKFRFEDFLKRHKVCSHEPPVYYFGPLMKKSEVPYIGNNINYAADWWSKVANTEVLQPPYPSYKKGTPIVRESYGYKYCVIFSNNLMPRLSEGGKIWLDRARYYLQKYMEQGVVDQNFLSKYDKKFNAKVATRSLKNVELDSPWFQSFAYATHPDAYLGAGLLEISIEDKFEVFCTPDLIEWISPGTWEQAWLVGKEQVIYWKNKAKEHGRKQYKEFEKYLEKRWDEGEKKAKQILEEMRWW